MNNHSWQCFSVQKFFSVASWEGQLLENSNWQHQDKAWQTSWWQCSVQKFFSAASWEGQIEAREQSHFSAPQLLGQTSWEGLLVEDFFTLYNWEGQPVNRNCQDQDQSSYLKQVSEFFQFIPWEGKPEIGFLLHSSPIPTLTLSDHVGLTFTDLSDLF